MSYSELAVTAVVGVLLIVLASRDAFPREALEPVPV